MLCLKHFIVVLMLFVLSHPALAQRVALAADDDLSYDCTTGAGIDPVTAYKTLKTLTNSNGFRTIVNLSGTCNANWIFDGSPASPGFPVDGFRIEGGALVGNFTVSDGAEVNFDNVSLTGTNDAPALTITTDGIAHFTGNTFLQEQSPAPNPTPIFHIIGNRAQLSFDTGADQYITLSSGYDTSIIVNAEDHGDAFVRGSWYFNGWPEFGKFAQADEGGGISEDGMACSGNWSEDAPSDAELSGWLITAPGCPL